MSWRDRVFGTRPPEPVVTSEPDPPSTWERLNDANKQVGSATSNLKDALNGRAQTVRVCATCRKPVPSGNVCPDGHFIA